MAVYVIGDIHGQFDKLLKLLHNAHLIDDRLQWIGDDATLWFLGDFFDRGEQGIDVVELLMRLQRQAPASAEPFKRCLAITKCCFWARGAFPTSGSS